MVKPLLDVMAQLRDPDSGCAWDIQQTFESIAPYTLEEAYEVADAIARGDLDDLRDELGDLLLQVVFHSQIASEQNAFTFEDVVAGVVDKMIRRHPHVFGDVTYATQAEQKAAWEAIKAQERESKALRQQSASNSDGDGDGDGDGDVSASASASAETESSATRPTPIAASTEVPESALAGIAKALPALKRADKIQRRAARVGFDWPDAAPIYDKIAEEADEVREAVASGNQHHMEDELGDLLFSVVNLARHYDIDAETALARANEKFSVRFVGVERLAARSNTSLTGMTLAELDALWDQAKLDSSGS
jgi:nucleoside triphosphate diphosphatase